MKKGRGALLSIILTTVLLFVYYGHFIMQANHIAYSPWGDGYKNYFTLAYYLKYDWGIHFSGMNYPFGEHIVFTDNQPAIAWLLKPIAATFPSFTNHIHGFISWAIFASVIFTAFIVFLILCEFGVSEIHAAVFATLIALLSPQIQRMHAHFSLSYACFVPCLLYLIIRFFKTNGKPIVFLWLVLLITFFAFIHVYYLAIAGLFILFLVFLHVLVHLRQIKSHWFFSFLLASSSLIPFVLFKIFMLVTDTISDRPQNPWGFVMNRSTMADIFLHPFSFTGEIAAKLFPNAALVYHFEGMGYIGLVSDICIIALLIHSFKEMFKKRNYLSSFYPFNYLLPGAFFTLLFAMAFPFSIDPIEKYYELLPFAVKQFRAAGRFNWIFYYTITILSTIFIYRLFTSVSSQNKILAYLLISSVYMLWFVDVNMISNRYLRVLNDNSYTLSVADDINRFESALNKSEKKRSDFQAIFPLPFFLSGSERIGIESSTTYDAMKTSFITGLPIAGGMMSRTSEKQTFQMARLASDDLMTKDILSIYKNTKPLLLVYNDQRLKPQEQKIFERAKYLFQANNATFYELPLSAFADLQDSVKQTYRNNRERFFNHRNYISTDSAERIVLLDYDKEPLKWAEFGKGAHSTGHNNEILYFAKIPNAIEKETYEVSVWVYADDRRSAFPVVYLSQVDVWGKDISQFELAPKLNCNVFGKWMRVDVSFALENRENKIYIAGNGDFGSYDELMIRPKNEIIISDFQNDSTFMFNNFPIR